MAKAKTAEKPKAVSRKPGAGSAAGRGAGRGAGRSAGRSAGRGAGKPATKMVAPLRKRVRKPKRPVVDVTVRGALVSLSNLIAAIYPNLDSVASDHADAFMAKVEAFETDHDRS